MTGIGRALKRALVQPKFQGIRFRLGMALAIALIPILILRAAQAGSAFRAQDQERRRDLRLAVDQTASNARTRLERTTMLLHLLWPDARTTACEPRLGNLIQQVEGLAGLARLDAGGTPVCILRGQRAAATPWPSPVRDTVWFRRLRDGETTVLARAPNAAGDEGPGLIVAIRLTRPDGNFDGAAIALLPLSSFEPNVNDPAMPTGTEVVLTDAGGGVLTTGQAGTLAIAPGPPVTGWVDQVRRDGSRVFAARDAEGQRRIYAGTALAGREVYALLSAPTPGLLSWTRLNQVGALLVPLLAFICAFVCVTLVAERVVVRWLVYLERIASIYTRGRFSVRPVQAANAPLEIRVLARTLDEMAASITIRDAALTTSLVEKDALMREIHHRVKNNLQVISSLLSMQQRALTDTAAKAAVGDTRKRISALALIYRTLYQSADLRYAEARIFLTELTGQLVAGEAGRGYLVTSSVDADPLVVDPDKLAPLALWLVEAITNAQTHAFADRGGDLQVRFRVRGETSVLEVQDDGPGVSATFRAGVGRTLMGAFAKQLRGEAEILAAPHGGTIARLTFATPEAIAPTDPADIGTARR